MSEMSIELAVIAPFIVGDIITVSGKNHKIVKKTRTAVAVTRYYFWHAAWDWITGKIGE